MYAGIREEPKASCSRTQRAWLRGEVFAMGPLPAVTKGRRRSPLAS